MDSIVGDIVDIVRENRVDVVVHGCNCFCRMKSGVAGALAEAFPEVPYSDIVRTYAGDPMKLGTLDFVFDGWKDRSTVVNAYTQYNYGRDGQRYVDYCAIKQCFTTLHSTLQEHESVAYPKIGAGLGGGDWDIISDIINKCLKNREHYLIEFPGDSK